MEDRIINQAAHFIAISISDTTETMLAGYLRLLTEAIIQTIDDRLARNRFFRLDYFFHTRNQIEIIIG